MQIICSSSRAFLKINRINNQSAQCIQFTIKHSFNCKFSTNVERSESIPTKLSNTKIIHPVVALSVRPIQSSGSLRSRELRKKGLIPGVIYGVNDGDNQYKLMVNVKQKELMKELRTRAISFENTLYEAVVHNGEIGDPANIYTKLTVVPRQTQLNPITDSPLSVNFMIYHPGISKLKLPVRYINEEACVDIKRDCYIAIVNRFIDCTCEDFIPSYIDVDLSDKQRGDVIRLNSLILPIGVRPDKKVPSDFVIGVVKQVRS